MSHHFDHVLSETNTNGPMRNVNRKSHPTALLVNEGILTDDEIIASLSLIKSAWKSGSAGVTSTSATSRGNDQKIGRLQTGRRMPSTKGTKREKTEQ